MRSSPSWCRTPRQPAAPHVCGRLEVAAGKPNPPGPKWYVEWDKAASKTKPEPEPFDFQGFVSLRGGEYFFAPSLNFFKSL